jgi:hypothetical protein
MAGQARYTALLDACVLYPLAMTDALLSIATTGLFAAKLTTRVVLGGTGCRASRCRTRATSMCSPPRSRAMSIAS